jgi:magnesium transporter
MKKRSKKAGLPPGSPIHIGDHKSHEVTVTLIDYDESSFNETTVAELDSCPTLRDSAKVSWFNVDGIHDVEATQAICDCFGYHPLLVEDSVNTDQRPKLEDFGEYLFIVLKMLGYDEEKRKLQSEQVSLILGERYVISFQELPGDVFDPLRQRLREGKGKIRKHGADRLAHALVDAVVDHYFTILEKVSEDIEELEDDVVSEPTQKTLKQINAMKRELLYLRRSIWPLREVVSNLERGDSPLIKKPTRVYFRDVYDHTIHVIDTIETFRDLVTGMLDIYLSGISNRMNEVMKVLTVIATIFIPLTFITGLYGMNFNTQISPLNMPELNWYLGYPLVLALMFLVAVFMFAYFRRRKWL